MQEIVLDEGELRPQLVDAFARLKTSRAQAVRLIFPGSATPNQPLADLLAELVAATPTLRAVMLSHRSPGIRFVASMLTLRVANVQFEASTATERGAPAATTAGDDERAPTPGHALVRPIASDDVARSVADIFATARDRRARAMVLLLDADRPVDRRLVPILGDALASLLTLELLVLVHPGAQVGFLASGLALRVPRVRVVPCATQQDAHVVVRARGS